MAYGDGALVRIDERTLLSPDVFVDCSPFDPAPQWFEAPVVIAEVLSETTEIRDRTIKWRLYRRLASLRDYLLVSQVERRIEHYARAGDVWRYLDLVGDHDVLRIEALGVEVPLREIYEGIVPSAEQG
jgi:Uma2 family endonuclease